MEWKKSLAPGVVLLSSLFVTSCGGKSPGFSGPSADAAAVASATPDGAIRTTTGAAAQPMLAANGSPQSGKRHSRVLPWRFDQHGLRIASFDGVELAATLFTPKEVFYPGRRPTIIFVNSWASDEHEYDGQARQFADAGYLVLSYCTRGFGTSGGLVTVAGPDDIKDVSTLIDWLAENAPADLDHLGMAGISYGAGISLLAAGHDPRIRAVAAMSGWGNLKTAIFGNDTVREVWMSLLVASGSIAGRLSPEIYTQVLRLQSHTGIKELTEWAKVRSPEYLADALNARHVAVYLANSYQDNLFPPAQMRPLFENLTGPKMFFMDRGIHAMSSVPGAFGLPSDIWDDVHDWMDQYIVGTGTGIAAKDQVVFKTDNGREAYPHFPGLSERDQSLPLHLLNQNTRTLATGSGPVSQLVDLIGSIDSGATSGIPLISDTADAALNLKVFEPIDQIDQSYAAMYATGKLPSSAKLRGSAHLTLPLAANDGPSQLVGYLYDVNEFNIGTLISYGVVSRYAPIETNENVAVDLGIIAYDVPAGHSLVVAVDTRDPLYLSPVDSRYNVSIVESTTSSAHLDLPIVH